MVVIGATNRPTLGDARDGAGVPGVRRQLVLVWVALRWASAVVRAIGAAGAPDPDYYRQHSSTAGAHPAMAHLHQGDMPHPLEAPTGALFIRAIPLWCRQTDPPERSQSAATDRIFTSTPRRFLPLTEAYATRPRPEIPGTRGR